MPVERPPGGGRAVKAVGKAGGTGGQGVNQCLKAMERLMRLRNCSPRTIETYLQFNRQFLRHAKKPPAEITVEDIRRYQEHLMDRGLSIRRVNLGLSALRFFCDRVLGKGLFADYERPRPPEKLPVVMTREEVRSLIETAPGPRARLLIEFLYGTGLRLSECARLRRRDLDLDQGRGWVRGGKGGRDRPFRIPGHLVEGLRSHLEGEALAAEWLFPGRRGHIAPRTIQKVVSGGLGGQGFRSGSRSTPYGTPSPPTCSRQGTTSGGSRSCWATGGFPPPKSTRECPPRS